MFTVYFITTIAELVMFVTMADPKLILPSVLLLYLLRLYLRRRRRSLRSAGKPLVSRRALQIFKTRDFIPWSLQSLNLQNPTNLEDIINLASDQNYHCIDLINARLKNIDPNSISAAIANTNHQRHEIPAFTNAVASYITRATGKNVSFEPSRMVITAGVAAATETLSLCVSDSRGDAILVPSPYNPCYDKDIGWRSGVELVQVPCRSSDDFEITANALTRVLRTCKFRRLVPRALLISNPCNPTGKFMRKETLLMLFKFAIEKQIHIICDETQATSLHSNPDQFISIIEILNPEDIQKSNVHVIYDLGIPGFNVGVIYTYNDKILEAAQQYARNCTVSFDVQSLLAAVLSDDRFVEEYVRENRRRLRKRFREFYIGLERAGVRCVAGSGGVFCWGEIERLLGVYSEKGEVEMWEELTKEAKILATPGCDCRCIQRGWFRWSFGSFSEEEMTDALKRIEDFVRRRRQKQLSG